jgi:tRNA (mo5U34)-methyltransferase
MTLAEEVAAVPLWWHSIDLGGGVVTPGWRGLNDLEADAIEMLPYDLTGKTVLDVGAWDGFFSFAAERRGAARVVAIDDPSYRHRASGKESIELCAKALDSKVEIVWGDWMTTDFDPFDIVIFSGVIYHCRDPLRSLERLRQLTKELAAIESHCEDIGGQVPMLKFFERDELNGDATNWWGPNLAALEAMTRAAGFTYVHAQRGAPRAILHAYPTWGHWYT